MKPLSLALLPSILAALSFSARAANITWALSGTGPWTSPPNWTGGVLPAAVNGTTDVAQINNTGTATVGAGDAVSAGAFHLGTTSGGSGALLVSGGSLTTLTTSAVGTATGSIGTMQISGGTVTLNAGDFRVGGSGSNATGTMEMSAGTLTILAGNFNVGFGPTAGGASGTVILSGGTVLVRNPASIMAVGNRGTGTVTQTGGDLYLSSSGATPSVLNLGRNSTTAMANGSYHLSGGSVTAAELRFGNAILAGATNTFQLSGTGSLTAGSITIVNTSAANSLQFNGGSLATNTVNIPLTNNGGTLQPGGFDFTALSPANVLADRTGTTTFGTNISYVQKSGGTLAIDIDGAGSNDLVSVGAGTSAGSANIGGTIAVTLVNGYSPAPGESFDIVTADTIALNAPVITGSMPAGTVFAISKVTGGDGREVLRLTVTVDADNDAMPDAWETAHGLNTDVNDAASDGDNDFSTNLQEYQRGTDPQDNDSDNDGLLDGAETLTGVWVNATNTGTSPLAADSDGDGLSDGLENPDLPHTGPAQPGTDPNNPDSDNDLFSDGEEIAAGSNPDDINSAPNPAAGSLLAIDFNSTGNVVQPGFTGMDPASGWTGNFGGIGITVTPVGCTIDHRDRAAAGGGGGYNRLFADFIFGNLSDQDGDGLDISITGLTPLKTYPITLWSWDSSSAAVPRHSTWLASEGDGAPVVKVPVYSLESPAPLAITDKRIRFDATADSAGNLLIRGIKEAGYFPAPTPPTHHVFLNALMIGPAVTPLTIAQVGPTAANSFSVSWTSDAFATYRVERSGNLLNWSPASGILNGQNGTTSFTDNSIPPGTTRNFYRVTRVSP